MSITEQTALLASVIKRITALERATGSLATEAGLAAHLSDTAAAHAASAVSYAGGSSMSATDVEAALDELADERVLRVGDTMTGPLTIIVPGAGASALVLENSSGDANEGGELALGGAGSKTDWFMDNFNGDVRFHCAPSGALLVLSPTNDRIWVKKDLMMGAGGALYLGGATAAAGPRITSDGSYIHLDANGDIYADGTTHWFRDAAGNNYGYFNNAELGLYNARKLLFPTYGGGLYMEDATWVRVYAKNLYVASGLIATEGALIAKGSADNSRGLRVHSLGAYIGDTGFNHTNKSWSYATIRLENSQASGNTALVGISFNPANAGIAPIWQCNGNDGEVLQALNNPNTGWIPIYASAFTVSSSIRFKDDIEHLDDDDVLARAKQVKPVRFRNKVRPQNIRQTAGFADTNARWVERGKSPLTPMPHHMESADHDCAIDPCVGTADDPCCIALNDTGRIGVLAEQVYEVFPEAVQLDADRRPLGVNVDQLAALALTAVGALTRKVEQQADMIADLAARLERLEQRP